MTLLSQQTCQVCNASALLLQDEQIKVLFTELQAQSAKSQQWQLVEDQGVLKLACEFSTKRYQHSIAFVNQIAELAESVNHHPLLVVEYGVVTVQWWSHIIKGLHRNDFIMAVKTSELFSAMTLNRN